MDLRALNKICFTVYIVCIAVGVVLVAHHSSIAG